MLNLLRIFALIAGIAASAPSVLAQDQPLVIANYPAYGLAIPPEQRNALQPLVTKILDTVRAGGRAEVRIFGHADFDVQGPAFVTKKSEERATVAQQTLMSMLLAQADLAGISRDKLLAALDVTITAMGTKHPRAPNPQNELDRRMNRRVEIFWTMATPTPPPPPPPNPRPKPPEPPPPDDTTLRVVGAGIGCSANVQFQGEWMVRFVVRNVDALSTSVTITDLMNGGSKTKDIPPGKTVELEFAMAGGRPGPRTWSFEISSRAESCMVAWQALSFARPQSR